MEETVMDFDEYEIRHYHPEFYLQVIDLLKYLLGSDDAGNQVQRDPRGCRHPDW